MSQLRHYDIAISGAGIAGGAMALAMSKSPLRIALLEPQAAPSIKHGLATAVVDVSPRVSALSIATQNYLQRWGVWPLIEPQRCAYYQHMQVWDSGGGAAVTFDSDEVGLSQLGCIVENSLVIEAQRKILDDIPHIDFIQPATLQQIQRNESNSAWRLQLDNQQVLEAPLLIAADGANSFVRQGLEFATREWDYKHHAIVATVETEHPHAFTARQCFLPSGPLAFLPLNSHHQNLCSIVWSVQSDQLEALLMLGDAAFLQRLGQAFEFRLGAVKAVSKRYSFALRQRHAIDYVQPGVALVGDAAHTLHPLAGQGINLGLEDVNVLSDELLRAYRKGLNMADEDVLRRYQRRRKAHNLGMMLTVEAFSRLFDGESLYRAWLRNTGMRWFNNKPMIKKQIIRRALGI